VWKEGDKEWWIMKMMRSGEKLRCGLVFIDIRAKRKHWLYLLVREVVRQAADEELARPVRERKWGEGWNEEKWMRGGLEVMERGGNELEGEMWEMKDKKDRRRETRDERWETREEIGREMTYYVNGVRLN
jgi:hypothetical protein